MSTYLIGDVHGCFNELQALLAQVSFNAKCDQLWLTGDLVARGPNSLEVLRFVRSLGPAVRLVLGNHDLHLLAIYVGVRRITHKDRMSVLLEAPDIDELINWLRCQPMLQVDDELKIIMTHAGIPPQWKIQDAKICSHEIESCLCSDNKLLFLKDIYSDKSNHWTPELNGFARLHFSINALTRMRYCAPNGQLDMIYKDAPGTAPAPLQPWFSLPRLVDSRYTLIFGHWASLNGQGTPKNVIGLDTGCCWGGALTMLRWEDRRYFIQPAK
ncbi:bis(5'-nucleosyl)-tetraphosphatase (symmetrical) ApaH [Candidatus Gillettellia adelgis]